MRIVITSDLSFNQERHSSLASLVRRINELSPSMLVLAGNIGQSPDNFEQGLDLFSNAPYQKVALLGNLDVWRTSLHSSEQLWNSVLPSLCERAGFEFLERANVIANRVGVCGTIGWYDYSGRDPRLKYTVEQYQELKGLVNFDAQNVDWPWSDQDFAGSLQSQFTARLEDLEKSRDIDHIVIVTHVPVFGDAIIRSDSDMRWNFGAAYAFNLTLGRVIAPRNKVRHVASGHLKRGGDWQISFGTNTFQFSIIGQDADETPRIIAVDL